MNLLEHYILEVLEKKVVPPEYVDMWDGERHYFQERLVVKYKVNCYGSESIVTETYFDMNRFKEDLKRGYILR